MEYTFPEWRKDPGPTSGDPEPQENDYQERS